jgi:hypothetical protein
MGELEKKLFQQEPAMPHSCDCPTWIYNVICPGLFLHLLFSEMVVTFVDFGEIVDHHSLNFLFIIVQMND